MKSVQRNSNIQYAVSNFQTYYVFQSTRFGFNLIPIETETNMTFGKSDLSWC